MSKIFIPFSGWYWEKAGSLFASAGTNRRFCTLRTCHRPPVLTVANCSSPGDSCGCWEPGTCKCMCSLIHSPFIHSFFQKTIHIRYLLAARHSSRHLGYISEHNWRKPQLSCSLHFLKQTTNNKFNMQENYREYWRLKVLRRAGKCYGDADRGCSGEYSGQASPVALTWGKAFQSWCFPGLMWLEDVRDETRGQIMQGLTDHWKDISFYSEWGGVGRKEVIGMFRSWRDGTWSTKWRSSWWPGWDWNEWGPA